MSDIAARLETAEREIEFRFWILFKRMLETFTEEELKDYVSTGKLPDRPDPLPGESRFDQMDRRSLLRLWKEGQEHHEGRNRDQLRFYGRHGHWPEQGCDRNCMKSEFVNENRKRDAAS